MSQNETSPLTPRFVRHSEFFAYLCQEREMINPVCRDNVIVSSLLGSNEQ